MTVLLGMDPGKKHPLLSDPSAFPVAECLMASDLLEEKGFFGAAEALRLLCGHGDYTDFGEMLIQRRHMVTEKFTDAEVACLALKMAVRARMSKLNPYMQDGDSASIQVTAHTPATWYRSATFRASNQDAAS